jgi:hypothetical protein
MTSFPGLRRVEVRARVSASSLGGERGLGEAVPEADRRGRDEARPHRGPIEREAIGAPVHRDDLTVVAGRCARGPFREGPVSIEHVRECCRPVRGRNPADGPVGRWESRHHSSPSGVRPEAIEVPGRGFLLLHAAGPRKVRPTEEILEADPAGHEQDPACSHEAKNRQGIEQDVHGYHQHSFCRKQPYACAGSSVNR